MNQMDTERHTDSERRTIERHIKEKVGRVVSDKMDKTVVVEVEVVKRHRLYHRALRRHRRFKAHDENNQAKTGDLVRLVETRPLSKEKRWRVAEIVKRGEQLEATS
jgi:small subunit ribosomal protein S17